MKLIVLFNDTGFVEAAFEGNQPVTQLINKTRQQVEDWARDAGLTPCDCVPDTDLQSNANFGQCYQPAPSDSSTA